MTESEFQEFLITIGYRYNKKSHSAFNSYEGFHTIIEFNDKENRYSLSMGTLANDPAFLIKGLKDFASENKEYITRAVYKDKRIRITIRMTVDSEIDREHLKTVAKYVMDLCKSEKLEPLCQVCSRNRKTGLYIIGEELMPICDNCINRKRRQYEHRRDMFEKKKQNMLTGIFGALFGAALGASLYVLLYQITPFFGIWGGLIALLSFCGFVITGHRATRLSAVLCEIISFFALIAAEYTSLIAGMSILIEHEGGGIAVTEAISVTNASLVNMDYLMSVLVEVGIGVVVMLIIGGIYFLKRSLTRPLRISKNIL